MKVDVRNVSRAGEPLVCDVAAGAVGELCPGVRAADGIELSCLVRRLDDTVEVQGTVRGAYRVACSRCLAEFEQKFDVSVEGMFVMSDVRHDSEEENGSTGEDSYTYDGLEIDIVPMVRDELILDAPVKPLCSTKCKGLCSVCGSDLNRESCSCKMDDVDPRLAVLKDMFSDTDL